MTAWGSVDVAVEAMRRGAIDFSPETLDNDRLLATIGRYGARTESETRRARRIQQSVARRAEITIPGLDYAGVSLAVGDIGGDYMTSSISARAGSRSVWPTSRAKESGPHC